MHKPEPGSIRATDAIRFVTSLDAFVHRDHVSKDKFMMNPATHTLTAWQILDRQQDARAFHLTQIHGGIR